MRNLATGCPLGVNRSSGSSTRLPLMVSWVSFMVWSPSWLVPLTCGSVLLAIAVGDRWRAGRHPQGPPDARPEAQGQAGVVKEVSCEVVFASRDESCFGLDA